MKNLNTAATTDVLSLLDPEHCTYVYDQKMTGPGDEEPCVQLTLFNRAVDDEDIDRQCIVFLFPDEESIGKLVENMKAMASGEVSWEYAEDTKAETKQAYILHVVDQDNHPVGEVSANFCTDTACVPQESDENGLITFTGAPDVYHVQIIDVPEGYSWDEDYEMYTSREYGEWVLRVRKDSYIERYGTH